jgi:hypothetical protein
MNKGKLQHAIIDFIAHSTSLDAILFDSVAFKPELYAKLGSALSNRKGSELRTLTFRQVPLGTSGLRALCPHLGRLPIQRLDLERCGLDDLSGPFIASLLKAQGARLDQLWERGRAFLGTRYAIMGGAMSWVSERHLVAAISNAGGFGTLDELFETLTLVQCKKAKPVPIVLFGSNYWKRLFNPHVLVEEGVISEEDLDLFTYVDSVNDAWDAIRTFYEL